jgi:8-oxo-dGTP pyrophosphatase MutT (NUDIX family)
VVTPREAATVMLVRDAPELEVFMLRRSTALEFVGGASVFPGGALDPGDRDPRLLDRCVGWTDAEASAAIGVAAGGLGFWVAAVRETFEEAGVLLAHRARTGEAVDASEPALTAARGALNAGTATFVDVVLGEDLLLDTAGLRPCSRWITPAGAPRRYDTRFFLVAAPAGHAYEHDDGEAVASGWIRPHDALAAFRRGEIDLILPTVRCLEALATHPGAAAAVAGLEQISGNAADDAGAA